MLAINVKSNYSSSSSAVALYAMSAGGYEVQSNLRNVVEFELIAIFRCCHNAIANVTIHSFGWA